MAQKRLKRDFSLAVLVARGKGDEVKKTFDDWDR
jgi:hypothetical protein